MAKKRSSAATVGSSIKETQNQDYDEGIHEGIIIDESVIRTALFATVEGGANGTELLLSYRPLVKIFFWGEGIEHGLGLTSRQQKDAILSCIRSHKFHKGYARRLFAGLTEILQKIIEEEHYVPSSAYESDEEEELEDSKRRISGASTRNPEEILPDNESTEALLFMKACAITVNAYLDGLVQHRSKDDPAGKIYPVVDEAFAVGELLHDTLFALQSCGNEGLLVQAAIANLCENWWQQKFVDRDYMVVQLIPFLVIKSLDGSAQKNDVKRLFMMREAFNLLDFEEETIAYLRSLLLRTVSSPLYLRMIEGKRMIAYLFHLHESLVLDLHQAIRVQIPGAKATVLEAYGNIYFRAWKESEPESVFRVSIEENALQDLMYAAIHVSTPTMAKSLLTVLEPLHAMKKSPDVEKLLHDMYGPIMWRSLRAANPRIRVNAASVLAETFPLQDPTSGHTQLEKSVQKGISALKSLLVDPDQRVRVAGSESTAKILTTFWDVIPATDIRMLLNHIVTEHSSDSSTSAVRTAAINAITTLLEAPQSHAVLRALLPSLGNLIHDKVERVRLAVVRMLISIKSIRGIKYYHVVPVDHLVARLAEEGRTPRNPQGPVASALTALLLNSYFPQGPNISGADQIKRTLSFLSTNAEAASVFYHNLSSHLSVNSISKLAAMLLRCLSAAVESDKAHVLKCKITGRKRGRGSSPEGEMSLATDDTLTAANTSLMAALAETICSLWESVEEQLNDPQNQACSDFLHDAFSGAVLTEAYSHFDQKASEHAADSDPVMIAKNDCYRSCAAILRCAGRLPPKAVEGLASHITTKLANVDANDAGPSTTRNLSSHVALLCLWGMTEDVAKSLSSSIEGAFGNANDLHCLTFHRKNSNSNKRKSETSARSKRSEAMVVPPLPPQIALNVLNHILSGPDPSSVAVRSSIIQSITAFAAFEKALERATVLAATILNTDRVTESTMEETEVLFVLRACESYGRLALHKEASRNEPKCLSSEAKTLLTWTTNIVVPVLLRSFQRIDTPLKGLKLSHISAATESPNILPCSPSPMKPPRRRANRNNTPTRFDTTFDSMGDDDNMKVLSRNEPIEILAHTAALSLLKSSCFIFSEWLVVGGAGSAEIAECVGKWCQVFSCADDAKVTQEELLPVFCRLAVQLCHVSGNFTVLKQLIVNTTDEYDADLLKKAVKSVLTHRDSCGSSLVTRTVNTVLDSAYDLLKGSELCIDELAELPTSISEFWQDRGNGVEPSISALISNSQSAIVFAKEIVQNLDKGVVNGSSVTSFFEVKCLSMLCERYSSRTDFVDIVRQLDSRLFQSDLKTVIGEIVDGVV